MRSLQRLLWQGRVLLVAAFTLIVTLLPRVAMAHGVRTGSLRVDELGPTHAVVRWSVPVTAPGVGPTLPEGCTSTKSDELSGDGLAIYALECPGGLAGQTLGVHGLGPIVTEATVLVRFTDGHDASHLVTANDPSWTLPRAESALTVARSYVRAGLVHIATGADHLLFLALLVLVLRRVRAVLLAETAFTLSHSLAFSATALGWIHVRPALVEACIALSLVLLALDVRGGRPTASTWRGAATALVFGLVHGLGFAGGLREAGLPDAHAAIALLGFGAGVELGQVAFLAVVLALVAVASRMRSFPRLVGVATVFAGGLAMLWLVERLVVCFGA